LVNIRYHVHELGYPVHIQKERSHYSASLGGVFTAQNLTSAILELLRIPVKLYSKPKNVNNTKYM